MKLGKLILVFCTTFFAMPFASLWAALPEEICQSDPTLTCIKSFLTENISVAQNNKESWAMAEDLTRAGLYEEAKKVLATTKSTLSGIAVRNMIVFPITVEALSVPNSVADLGYYDRFFVENPELNTHGVFTSKSEVYSALAFSLAGRITESGQRDYVHYTDKAALDQFKQNATWNELIKKWSAEVDTLPEPEQTNKRVRIAERLIEIDKIPEARNQLGKTGMPGDISTFSVAKAWVDVGEYDKAIAVAKLSKHETSYYRARIAKAEHLISQKDTAEAIAFLMQTADEIKSQKGEVGRWESLIRVIRALRNAGAIDQASELAAFVTNGIKGTPTGNLAKETASQAYRAAGDLEMARSIMRQLARASGKKCTIIRDEINGHYATELYLLGMADEFKKVMKNICADTVRRDTWINTYSAARDADIPLPDVEEIISDLKPSLHPDVYNSLSAVHFKHGETEIGVKFLDQAVATAKDAKTADVLCDTANLAYFSGNLKFLPSILASSIIVANRSVQTEKPKYKGFLSKFLSPEQKPVDPDILKYRQFLETAACFNLIEMYTRVRRG